MHIFASLAPIMSLNPDLQRSEIRVPLCNAALVKLAADAWN